MAAFRLKGRVQCQKRPARAVKLHGDRARARHRPGPRTAGSVVTLSRVARSGACVGVCGIHGVLGDSDDARRSVPAPVCTCRPPVRVTASDSEPRPSHGAGAPPI